MHKWPQNHKKLDQGNQKSPFRYNLNFRETFSAVDEVEINIWKYKIVNVRASLVIIRKTFFLNFVKFKTIIFLHTLFFHTQYTLQNVCTYSGIWDKVKKCIFQNNTYLPCTHCKPKPCKAYRELPQGKTPVLIAGSLFSLQGFPCKPCTSLLGIAFQYNGQLTHCTL